MRPRQLLVALVTALLAVLALGAPALAADGVYPPAGVRVVAGEVTPSQVEDGQSVTFSGGGYAPGALLRLSLDGVDTGTITADAAGAFSTVVVLRGAGEHTLAASGLEAGGRVRVVSATAEVLSAATTTSGGGLPTSGANLVPPLLGGLGLVVVGAVLVFLTRHRPRQRALNA